MTESITGTLLIVPGKGAEDDRRRAGEVVRALAARLGQPVALCLQEDSGEPVVAGIRSLVASGVRRLVVIPLLPSREQYRGVAPVIKWASRRWPFLTFHFATPLTWQEWASLLREMARDALAGMVIRLGQTAVMIVGAGSSDPLTNADLARLAYLVSDGSGFARVDYAFLDAARPRVPDVATLLRRLSLRNIVLVPWPIGSGDTLRRLSDQAEQAARARKIRTTVATIRPAHPAFIDLLVSHYEAALEDDSLLGPGGEEILSEIAQGAHGHRPGQATTPQEEAQLQELDRKINAMLPPRCQGRNEEVSSRPMGSAPLKFGSDGKVAWDEMWTSFCDLALAGGPPHRGTLLEAVSAADALAEPEKYQAVVAEIERGITLVTGLPVIASKTPGWVGVRCDSEEMAIWLLRAITVENVIVRREDEIIYLPAGPQFTLKHEIKNVITVAAKTCHYWTAHLVATGQGTPHLLSRNYGFW